MDIYWTSTGQILDICTAYMLIICCLKGGNKLNKALVHHSKFNKYYKRSVLFLTTKISRFIEVRLTNEK